MPPDQVRGILVAGAVAVGSTMGVGQWRIYSHRGEEWEEKEEEEEEVG